jgi:glycosyltransferase involved in cell wall biosynthesis
VAALSMPQTVSVIVPCYNQGRFLAEALDSVQAQTHPRWECVIVNDGSTDETSSVARRYSGQDARFKYVEQENRGLPGARNRGLREISGEYIQFLDADDVIDAAKLELQLALLASASRPALAFCDHRYGAEDDIRRTIERHPFYEPRFRMARPIEDIAARWETELSIPIHCFLFDSRLFRERGILFDERLPNHEDWDCWMRVLASDPEVLLVPQPLVISRYHPRSMSRNAKRMRRGFLAAIDTQLASCKTDPVLVRLLRQKRAQMKAVYAEQIGKERLAWRERQLPWRLLRAFRRLLGTAG